MHNYRWAFFSYAHNLGDISRAIEVAKGIIASGGEVKFFNHGGRYLYLIEEAGIEFENLYPGISKEQDEIVMAINQFRAPIGTPLPFSEQDLKAMVEADIKALKDYHPDGVYCGLNISSMISVPYLGYPRVTQVPTTLCPAFYEMNLATFPNTMEKNFFIRNLIPQFIKRKFFNSIMLKDILKGTVVTFNKIRKEYNLPPIYNSTEFVKGDLVLLPDLPILSGLPENKLPKIYKYTGPVFFRDTHKIPEKAKELFQKKGINIFCSLGSSGSPEILKIIINSLKTIKGINVVCTTTSIMEPEGLGTLPDNFFISKFLPSHKVNEIADIAITHGGQGTIQAAVWSGTPVIGIGFQSEQQANIDGLVRNGMGIRISLYDVSDTALRRAINKIQDPSYRISAINLKNIVRNTDGVGESVRLMNQLISNK